MAIYDINFSTQSGRLLPPSKRQPRWLAWFSVLMYPLQWLRDLFFQVFVPGFAGAKWDSVTVYVKGDRVRFIDRKVYEALQAVPANTPPDVNPDYWLPIQNLWIGLEPRAKYNSQKLLLEFVLNQWFDSMFRQPTSFVPAPNYYLPKSDIYISDNSLNNNVFTVFETEAGSSVVYYSQTYITDFVIDAYSFSGSSFTINVPTALWTTLGTNNQEREDVVRAIADKYIIYGIKYSIINY